MAFIYFEVTTTPQVLTGLVDGRSYAGQNSPDNPDRLSPTPIYYRQQADADAAPTYSTTNRAILVAFATGEFNAIAGETIYVWCDNKTATLVLVDRGESGY